MNNNLKDTVRMAGALLGVLAAGLFAGAVGSGTVLLVCHVVNTWYAPALGLGVAAALFIAVASLVTAAGKAAKPACTCGCNCADLDAAAEKED